MPNLITILRLLLTPFVVYHIYQENWKVALYIGFVAIVSDFFDGFTARKFKMESELGRKLDPIVDKVLLLSVFFVIYEKNLVPRWFALTVIAKDAMIPFILAVGKLKGVELNFSPTRIGKLTVALQFIYVFLLMIEKNFGLKTYHHALILPTVILCFLSVISYVMVVRGRYHGRVVSGRAGAQPPGGFLR